MWTWRGKMGLNMEARTRWQCKLHIFPMQGYQSFWMVNESMCISQLNGIKAKTWSRKKIQKANNKKSP
jgi:hypothetical protein